MQGTGLGACALAGGHGKRGKCSERETRRPKHLPPLSERQERLLEEMTSKLRPEVREELVSEERYTRC